MLTMKLQIVKELKNNNNNRMEFLRRIMTFLKSRMMSFNPLRISK